MHPTTTPAQRTEKLIYFKVEGREQRTTSLEDLFILLIGCHIASG